LEEFFDAVLAGFGEVAGDGFGGGGNRAGFVVHTGGSSGSLFRLRTNRS